jgi:hypothetical protein
MMNNAASSLHKFRHSPTVQDKVLKVYSKISSNPPCKMSYLQKQAMVKEAIPILAGLGAIGGLGALGYGSKKMYDAYQAKDQAPNLGFGQRLGIELLGGDKKDTLRSTANEWYGMEPEKQKALQGFMSEWKNNSMEQNDGTVDMMRKWQGMSSAEKEQAKRMMNVWAGLPAPVKSIVSGGGSMIGGISGFLGRNKWLLPVLLSALALYGGSRLLGGWGGRQMPTRRPTPFAN